MSKKIFTHVDMNQQQIKNLVLETREGNPENPVVGQIYFNLTELNIKVWSGREWVSLSNQIKK